MRPKNAKIKHDGSNPPFSVFWIYGFINTMRAEIVACMLYLEGSEFSEYVMHIFYT